LILLKLYALPSLYREGNGQKIGLYENDIYTLCLISRPAMEPILAELALLVDRGQLSELRSITLEIQRRIDRVDRAKRRDAETGPA
jgi:hypothetical protein